MPFMRRGTKPAKQPQKNRDVEAAEEAEVLIREVEDPQGHFRTMQSMKNKDARWVAGLLPERKDPNQPQGARHGPSDDVNGHSASNDRRRSRWLAGPANMLVLAGLAFATTALCFRYDEAQGGAAPRRIVDLTPTSDDAASTPTKATKVNAPVRPSEKKAPVVEADDVTAKTKSEAVQKDTEKDATSKVEADSATAKTEEGGSKTDAVDATTAKAADDEDADDEIAKEVLRAEAAKAKAAKKKADAAKKKLKKKKAASKSSKGKKAGKGKKAPAAVKQKVWLERMQESARDYPLGFMIDQGQHTVFPELPVMLSWLLVNVCLGVAVMWGGFKIAAASDVFAAFLACGSGALCLLASAADFILIYYGKTHRDAQIAAAGSPVDTSNVAFVIGEGLPFVLHWIAGGIARTTPFLGLLFTGYIVDRLPGKHEAAQALRWRNPFKAPPLFTLSALAPLSFWVVYFASAIHYGEDTVDLTQWASTGAMLVAVSCAVCSMVLLKTPHFHYKWTKPKAE